MFLDTLTYYSLTELPYYTVYGRTSAIRNPLSLFWTGSGLELIADGTELWIDLESCYTNHPVWICIELNGCIIGRQMLSKQRQNICLFHNMNPVIKKNIRLFRETQPVDSETDQYLHIHGLYTNGTFYPVPEKPLKLEFIGDSITTGEGTYGAGSEDDWITAFMSLSKNYVYQTSLTLNAEFRVLSQSGWGVLSSWDNNPRLTLPSCYCQTAAPASGKKNRELGASSAHCFSSWQPDAIIVNLGTNDAGAFTSPAYIDPDTGFTFKQHLNADGSFFEPDLERFRLAVISFLHMLRANNPNTQIVWVYGMLGDEIAQAITEAIMRYQNQAGDTDVSFLKLPNTTPETAGSRMHPGHRAHLLAAEVLCQFLSKLLENR